MTTQYNVDTYSRGVNGFGLPFCDTIYTATLAAATNTQITVPGAAATGTAGAHLNKFQAVISIPADAKVWVSVNATAAIPAGASFAASTSELFPAGEWTSKYVKAGDVINMICTAGSDVSVAFYAFQA